MDFTMEKTKVTRQNNILVAKGSLAVIWGIAALFCMWINPMVLITSFGILNLAAALLTLLYAFNNKHLRIAHQWLILEGMVELVAGVVFLFFVPNMAYFLQYMSYGIIFIVTLQFIYGYTLLLMNRVHPKNMVARFVSLLAGVVFSVGLLGNIFNPIASFVLIGIFSIIYGLLNIQFAIKLRNIILGDAVN